VQRAGRDEPAAAQFSGRHRERLTGRHAEDPKAPLGAADELLAADGHGGDRPDGVLRLGVRDQVDHAYLAAGATAHSDRVAIQCGDAERRHVGVGRGSRGRCPGCCRVPGPQRAVPGTGDDDGPALLGRHGDRDDLGPGGRVRWLHWLACARVVQQYTWALFAAQNDDRRTVEFAGSHRGKVPGVRPLLDAVPRA